MHPEQKPPSHAPRREDLNIPLRLSRWATWGCILFVLVTVFFFLGLFLVMFRSPDGRSSLIWSRNMTLCEQNMREISGALGRHYQDKGELPARLDDLHPTYLQDKGNLHCPTEDTPGKLSGYVYSPKTEWGNGKRVVVYCTHHPLPSLWRKYAPDKTDTFPAILSDGTTKLIALPPDATEKKMPAVPSGVDER